MVLLAGNIYDLDVVGNFLTGTTIGVHHLFFWHKFCDVYIEKAKERRDGAQPILIHVLSESLKLFHPFMPFITEEIWNLMPKDKSDKKALIVSEWPK